MDCTQILDDSEEDLPESSTNDRREVATLKTDGNSYPIFLGENRIGRDPKTCSIVIDNMALSSQHAVIEGLSCSTFIIYDLNSRNKTRIGKMSLTPQVRYHLKNGESLRFANVHCTFCFRETINLVHVSFDDDIDELKSDTKDESIDETSTVNDSIFDADTQKLEIMEKPSKTTDEKAESVFKMPQQIKTINTSLLSLDESNASNADDIFDLPTQPFAYEEVTGVGTQDKERPQKNSNPSSRAERLNVDKKHEKEDAEENIEDKDKSSEESDLDDLFAAATQAYTIESDKIEENKKDADGKTSCGSNEKSTKENALSSAGKEVSKKESQMEKQDEKDSDENDVFDLPTQAFTEEDKPCPKDKSKDMAANTEPSSSTTMPTKAEGGKVEKEDNVSESKESRESENETDKSLENEDDSDIDNIFGAATQVPPYMEDMVKEKPRSDDGDDKISKEDQSSSNEPVVEKEAEKVIQDGNDGEADSISAASNKEDVKEKEKVERKLDFSAEEDSDDGLFASLPVEEDEKPLKTQESSVSSQGGKNKVAKQSSSSVAEDDKQNEKENTKEEEVSGNDPDGDETDPEDSFSHKIEEIEAKSSNDVEKKTKVGPANVDNDAKETLVSRISSAKGNSDDDDTDLEDMCPPSIKKQSSQKSAFRKANDRDRTKLGISTISTTTTTSSKIEGSCVDVKEGEAKIDESGRKDDGVLADATLEDNVSMTTENHPGSIVIMSDTDDEEMDHAAVDLKTSKEKSKEKTLKTSEEVTKEKSTDAEVNKDKLDSQSGLKDTDKDANEEKKEKMSTDLKISEAVEQTSSEQIGTEEEDDDDMSSFLTQAPPDFKTPQATKIESIDDSDISLLETQPPSSEMPAKSKKANEEDLSVINQSSISNVTKDEKNEDDISSVLETPQATGKVDSIDESDISMLETQPPPRLGTTKAVNGNYKEDSTRLSSVSKGNTTVDDSEEDDMSSFLTQAPPDFKTPQAIKEESVDDSDVSLLETQPPPSSETTAESRKADKEELNESSASKVNTDEDEAEDDMSSFLTQAPPEFKTPQAANKRLLDESNISMMETPAPPSLDTQKIPSRNDKEDLAESSTVSKGNTTTFDEEEDDMSSFLTQVPPDLKTPQLIKEVSADESDISMLETQAPPSPETPKASKTSDKEDLSVADHHQSSTLDVNNGKDEDDEDDMSSFLTQAPPDFKTPQAVKDKSADDSDMIETPKVATRSDKDDSRKVDLKQSALNISTEDEDDMSSFLTQAPPEFKTPMAAKGDELDADFDVSILETQPAPFETAIASNGRLDAQEEGSKLLETTCSTSQKENIISGKEVKEEKLEKETSIPVNDGASNDEDDLSMLETQPAPTFKENSGDDEGEEDMSSFLTQAPPETPEVVAEKATEDKEGISTSDTQQPVGSKTQALPETPEVVAEKATEDKEGISTSDTQQPVGSKTLEESHESEDEDATQAPPDFCMPKVTVKKEPKEFKTPHGSGDECALPDSVVTEKLKSDSETKPKGNEKEEEDLELCETQPAPISVSQKTIPLTIKDTVCLSSNPGIEDVSSDEEDVSLLETQPAPTPEKNEVLNGKQEIMDIFKLPSKVMREVTPSRTLRKKIIQKNQKEARVSPSIKQSKTVKSPKVEEEDDDVGDYLPDSPDLAMTLDESKWSTMHPARKSLFGEDDSKINISNLSQETNEEDNNVKSAEIEERIDSSKISKDVKEGSEIPEKKQPEVERRSTRGNASKKLKVCPQVHSTVDEPTRKKGKSGKKQAENEVKARASEALSAILAKANKNEQSEVKELEVKHVEVEQSSRVSVKKEMFGRKRRLSSLLEELSSVGNDAPKSQPDVLASSPKRRHLRGEDKEVQPPAKELRARKKDDKSTLDSKTEESLPVHRLRGSHTKEDQSEKEAPSLPNIQRKRKLEPVKPDPKSPSRLPKSDAVEGVRRSVRERKPRRRFSSDEKPMDDGIVPIEESRRGKVARLSKKDDGHEKDEAEPEESRRGKVARLSKKDDSHVKDEVEPEESRRGKVARVSKKDDSHEKDEAEPEPVPQGPKKRNSNESKALGATKRTRSNLDEQEDSASSPSDKRRRKGRTVPEKSSDIVSKTESKENSSQKDERSTRGSSRRVSRDSNVPEKSLSGEHVAQEKCFVKLSPIKVTARGRKSSKQSVPESTMQDNEESVQNEPTKQVQNQPAKATRGGRRSSRKTTISEESIPVISSVESTVEPNESEPLKGQNNRRYMRNRGKKESDAASEVASSEDVTPSRKIEIDLTVEEKTKTTTTTTRGKGRKGSTTRAKAVDKEIKVSLSTSISPRLENVTVGAELSYLKSSPVKGRMTSLSPTASSITDSVSKDTNLRSQRSRRQKVESYNVLFTGLSEPTLEENVLRLGGKVVETPQDCNILVTDRLRRTYKLLCVVARGIPIVTAQWLVQSSSIGRFLDPANFSISDKLTEKRFDFSLKESLEKAREKPLLAGFSVIATPSVKPPPEEIKGIVSSAGGEYLPSISALQNKTPSQLYVLSCEDDSALWKNYMEGGAKKRPSRQRGKAKSAENSSNVRLVGVEGLLVSILRQKIDLDDEMFSLG